MRLLGADSITAKMIFDWVVELEKLPYFSLHFLSEMNCRAKALDINQEAVATPRSGTSCSIQSEFGLVTSQSVSVYSMQVVNMRLSV